MRVVLLTLLVALLFAPAVALGIEPPPGGPTAEEARAFMKVLAEYVRDHHLKRDAKSPQVGMIYEYFDTSKAGKLGQWIQGEGLNTMHDGAWFLDASAQAYRATRDPLYLQFLDQWTLPFYLKMLNHSDELFSPERDDSTGKEKFGKEHMLQKGEKGFVPYFWDDGASISLEASRRHSGKGVYPCRDELAGKPNPEHRLHGYSLGCSNHMAQDLAVMLLSVWSLARDDRGPLARRRSELAAAARNLHASRLKHHGHILVIDAALGRIADPEALKYVPVLKEWDPDNHYTNLLASERPGLRSALPGFSDDQEYFYWSNVARRPEDFPRAAAQRLIYDAFTMPLLFRYWSDNAVVPPGINRFDLRPIFARDGKLESYRSDQLAPTGSVLGPQNMLGSARALQLLNNFPGICEERYQKRFPRDLRVGVVDHAIVLDGKSDPGYSETVTLATVRLALVSDRQALYLLGDYPGDKAEITLYSQPDGKGRAATVTIHKDGTVAARGEGGAALQVEKHVELAAGRVRFEVRLPYQVSKKQGAWWTGLEHGRHSLRSGGATHNVYVASSEAQVKKALLNEVAGGLRTWQGIFKEKGYIPTSMNAGAIAETQWDYLSDTSGYAFLIAAAAQYLFYLEGARDWEQGMLKDQPPAP